MKLKDNLKQHIQQAVIPNVGDNIIQRMQHETLQENKNVMYWLHPFRVLKMATMLFMITGISLLFINNRENQTYAFSQYEDVLMQASNTAFALYEDDRQTIEEPVSTVEHVSLVQQELKTMIRYHLIFERLLVSKKPLNVEKINKERGFQLNFEYIDLEENVLPIALNIEKNVFNEQKDEFDFEGNFDKFELSGETRLVGSTHHLEVSITQSLFEIKIVYEDDTQTYHIEIFKDEENIQNFTYQVTYDTFNRPKISLTYQHESIMNTFELSHNMIKKQTNIVYNIQSNENIYEGDISIELKRIPNLRFVVTLTLDDGQTFTYQFNKPSRLQQKNNDL